MDLLFAQKKKCNVRSLFRKRPINPTLFLSDCRCAGRGADASAGIVFGADDDAETAAAAEAEAAVEDGTGDTIAVFLGAAAAALECLDEDEDE